MIFPRPILTCIYISTYRLHTSLNNSIAASIEMHRLASAREDRYTKH